MKIDIEVNIVGDRTFINFWDYMHGNDVITELKDGKLYQYQLKNDEAINQEITFQEYIDKVIKEVSKY